MQNTPQDWYVVKNAETVDSPALMVFPERVKANIRTALDMVKDPSRLRPHVKTNKSMEVADMMLEAGIYQFKCATIAEAEMLCRAGAKDILLAYQPVGPKIQRLINLAMNYPQVNFSCLIDHPDSAQKIAETVHESKLTFSVYIDLNGGTNRTGIAPGPEAEALYETATHLEGIYVKGFHLYDGHLRQKDLQERKAACDIIFREVEHMLLSLQQKGYPEPEVIAGGSTTFPIHLERDKVVCSPGTFVYWDAGYAEVLSEQRFEFAAVVLTRVISLPAENLVCVDLGHKSIASENPLENRVRFLNAENLTPVSQSEEHLVLKSSDDHDYKIGDILYGVPYHICPTVALYERMIPVTVGIASGEWRVVARDKMLTW